MPKFYVACGDLKIVIDRKNHKQAAIAAFKLRLKNCPENPMTIEVDLSELVKVGEAGFDEVQDEDMWFSALDIADEAGFEIKEIKKSRKNKEE